MKADFSRGYRPDHKRGERYRRVLLQQGRVVLDSDVAASVDAADRTVRDVAADMGGLSGSPDGGYIVTAGPLFALFDSLDQVTLGPSPHEDFRFYRDHGMKLLDRYPSLCLDATQGPGSVVIKSRRPFRLAVPEEARLQMLAHAPGGGVFSVSFGDDGPGTSSFLAADGTSFERWSLMPPAVAEYGTVRLSLTSGRAWIALMEGYQETGSAKQFWISRGRYYVDGLAVEQKADARFQDGLFTLEGITVPPLMPPVTTSTTTTTQLIAYLEASEQLVTAVEEPGLRERALGGALDTTVRTRALGRVKLANITGSPTAPTTLDAAVEQAFRDVRAGEGLLRVTTSSPADNTDPCAVPPSGGYTGADHRLYRFEVHEGGNLGAVTIKWSKNNGADLVEVASLTSTGSSDTVTLRQDLALRDGDLVELLTDHEALWDATIATVNVAAGSERFLAPHRARGELFVVRAAGQPQTYALLNPGTLLPAAMSTELRGLPGKKLRRWDGLQRTAITPTSAGAPVTSFDLDDGISFKLSGSNFHPGDWWEYEARVGASNANPSWADARLPHGPERLFAPLARVEHVNAESPLKIRHWYDHRFHGLRDLEADDIAYDGDVVGTSADTVQEALDELFQRGCCAVELGPRESGDDAVRIRQALTGPLRDGGVLCLRPGVYRLDSTIAITGRNVEIRGCIGALLLCGGSAPAFTIDGNSELMLRNLTFKRTSSSAPIVRFNAIALITDRYPTLRMRDSVLLHLTTDTNAVAIQAGTYLPATFSTTLDEVPLLTSSGGTDAASPLQVATLDLENCSIVAQCGVVVNQLRYSRMTGTTFAINEVALQARRLEGIELSGCTFATVYSDVTSALSGVIDARTSREAAAVVHTAASTSMKSPWGQVLTGRCLLANEVEDLTLRESNFRGEIAFWCNSVTDTSFARNTYNVYQAIRAKSATRSPLANRGVVVDGESIRARSFGVYVARTVDGLTVRACNLLASRAILVGAQPNLGANPIFGGTYGDVSDLQVIDNTFTATRHSATSDERLYATVQIGPAPEADEAAMMNVLPSIVTPAAGALRTARFSHGTALPPERLGRLDRVTINRNRFLPPSEGVASDVSVLCTLVDPADLVDTPTADGSYVGAIDNNEIQNGMVGILVRGPGWMVRNNTISLRPFLVPSAMSSAPFPMHAGIVAWDCGVVSSAEHAPPLMSIAGNSIDVSIQSAPLDITASRPAVAIAVRANVRPIQLEVRNNVIDCPNALISYDLGTINFFGNTVGSGDVLIRLCVNGSIRGNRILGVGYVELDMCTNMNVADNDLPNLTAYNIVASCQVQGNRARNILLLPAFLPISGATTPLIPPYSITADDYGDTSVDPAVFSTSLPPTPPATEISTVLQVNNNSSSQMFIGNPTYHPGALSCFQVNNNFVVTAPLLVSRLAIRLVEVGNFALGYVHPIESAKVLLAHNLGDL
ncbi:MAG: hypothetical protein JWM10_3164 [Myxococcaceae bacterium]|nr:hypothetical protein [Myxococcaceae bacterium]